MKVCRNGGGTEHVRLCPPPFFFPVLAVGLALGVACSSPENPDFQYVAPTVFRVDEGGIQRTIAGHHGKVVLLDVWATWCSPCVEHFPDLAKWQKKRGAANLAVVTLSLDLEDDLDTKVVPFLRKHGKVTMDFLLYTGGDHDKMVETIDPNWTGEVPAWFIYDRAGQLRYSLDDKHKPAEVERLIGKLLASPQNSM